MSNNPQQNNNTFSYNLLNDLKTKKESAQIHDSLKQKDQNLNFEKVDQIKFNFDERSIEYKNSIEEFWKKVDEQILAKSKISFKSEVLKESKSPKCIRVFVSSTFTDFYSERESLVKKVFPQLREWCNERNLDLIECDLRWGVPKDSTSDDTILTCLNELDRCYKENHGQPFFIGMLSEKYGWVPDIDKLPSKIKDKYDWIPKISITFMEFLHGLLRSRNQNACVFVRNKDSLKDIPQEFHEKFFEKDPYSKMQLEIEKDKLKNYTKNIFEYECKYEGLDESTGRKKVKLGGLQEFENKALRFLINSIQTFYPNLKSKPNQKNENGEVNNENENEKDEIENEYQNLYLNQKLYFHIERTEEINALINFINNKKQDLIQQEAQDQSNSMPCRSILLEAEEGYGKTSLMAYLINYLLQNDCNVFYHFFDASIASQSSRQFTRLFLKYFSKLTDLTELLQKFEFDQTAGSNNCYAVFEEACEKIFQTIDKNKKFVIIYDELEILTKFNDFSLNVPRNLPSNFTLIITSNIESNYFQNIVKSNENWYRMKLNYLKPAESQLFVEKYLVKYNKKLDDKQINLILSKPDTTKIPLWLSFACNELKIFGEFTTITNKIEALPNDLDNLIKSIIYRLNSEFEGDLILEALFLIMVSQKGIPEGEAPDILTSLFDNKNVDKLTWSQINLALKPFILFSPMENTQIIRLAHDRLHKIIENVLNARQKNIQNYHFKLIDFYLNKSKYRKYSVTRLCYHYTQVDDNHNFVKFLRSKEVAINNFINNAEKSNLFKKLRCKRTVFNQPRVQMCTMCSMKSNSNFFLTKDTCLICGSVVSINSAYACFCLFHDIKGVPNGMYKCSICKMLYSNSANNLQFKPVDAKLCVWCGMENFCAAIDGVN